MASTKSNTFHSQACSTFIWSWPIPNVLKPRKGCAAIMKPPAAPTRSRSSSIVSSSLTSCSYPKTRTSPWLVVNSFPRKIPICAPARQLVDLVGLP